MLLFGCFKTEICSLKKNCLSLQKHFYLPDEMLDVSLPKLRLRILPRVIAQMYGAFLFVISCSA